MNSDNLYRIADKIQKRAKTLEDIKLMISIRKLAQIEWYKEYKESVISSK